MEKVADFADIEEVRAEIDRIDKQIVTLLAQRKSAALSTLEFKADKSSLSAPEREKQLFEERRSWAAENELDPEVLQQLFQAIVNYCKVEMEKAF